MSYGIKDAWCKHFEVGAAVSRAVLERKENTEIIQKHFSSLTCENSMKFSVIHPEENRFCWDETDYTADFAGKNNLSMRGHTFVWHNQTPSWLFLDGNEDVSKNKLFKRLEEHIYAVAGRYKDAIYAWDVVNESIDPDSGDEKGFRLSKWYKIGGSEIFEFAFKTMRQAAPKAKLFYNDYNNECGSKLDKNIEYLSSFLDRGIPVDGVGIQGHWYYNHPQEEILRNALERYSALGIDIELTEVDISAYQWPEGREKSDFFDSMPQDRILQQAQRYKMIFSAAGDYPAVKNITTWGIADNHTWLDNFPVKERKNWPLLFDTEYNEKPVVAELIKSAAK